MSHQDSRRLALVAMMAIGIMSSGALAHADDLLFPVRSVVATAFDARATEHELSDPVMSRLFLVDSPLFDVRDIADVPTPAADGDVVEPNSALRPALPDDIETAPDVTTTLPQPEPGAQRSDLAFAQATSPQTFGGQVITPRSFSREGRRPTALVPLYATFAILQVLDATSTLKALDNGGREANPMVAPFTSNAGALYGLKAATAFGTILAVEKMWKRSRVGAIVTMVALNVGYAWVAHHNFSVARR